MVGNGHIDFELDPQQRLCVSDSERSFHHIANKENSKAMGNTVSKSASSFSGVETSITIGRYY